MLSCSPGVDCGGRSRDDPHRSCGNQQNEKPPFYAHTRLISNLFTQDVPGQFCGARARFFCLQQQLLQAGEKEGGCTCNCWGLGPYPVVYEEQEVLFPVAGDVDYAHVQGFESEPIFPLYCGSLEKTLKTSDEIQVPGFFRLYTPVTREALASTAMSSTVF